MSTRSVAAREVVYTGAAAAFAAFALWGSLFPFDVHRVAASEAVRLFWEPWLRGPATWSISDLVSNVLLFIPIGVFLTAAFDVRRTTLAPLLSVGFACAFSIGAELCQAFIPYRTPSAVDVLAETIGAALGAAAWRLWRESIDGRISSAIDAVAGASLPRRALIGYCALFAIGWLLPLDFTLRPGEIADKYEHKRLLLPFVPSPDAASRLDLAAVFAAGVPLGIASVACGAAPGKRRALASALRIAIPSLLTLEAIQVTVFSRTTDTTSLLAVIAATVAGASSTR